MFTNSLDNVKVSSPCPSDWNEMYGNERVRFCAGCKLNVYNLSDMTRTQAESLLIESEGRLCVRFYRRKDGTVITRDCPVGWKALKTRARKSVLAFGSIVVGFFAGLFGIRATESAISMLPMGDVRPVEVEDQPRDVWIVGESVDAENYPMPGVGEWDILGRVENVQEMKLRKVKAWVK